jgi:hypothetical protein
MMPGTSDKKKLCRVWKKESTMTFPLSLPPPEAGEWLLLALPAWIALWRRVPGVWTFAALTVVLATVALVWFPWPSGVLRGVLAGGWFLWLWWAFSPTKERVWAAIPRRVY